MNLREMGMVCGDILVMQPPFNLLYVSHFKCLVLHLLHAATKQHLRKSHRNVRISKRTHIGR